MTGLLLKNRITSLWHIDVYFDCIPNEVTLPSGYLTVRHGIDGPNRNRWFTCGLPIY